MQFDELHVYIASETEQIRTETKFPPHHRIVSEKHEFRTTDETSPTCVHFMHFVQKKKHINTHAKSV